MRVHHIIRLLAFCVCFTVSCDESLPPRSDPHQYLQGRIEGRYILAHQDNFLAVHIFLTNAYDETLVAEASIEGRLIIQSRRDPSIVKTVDIDTSLITSAFRYDPATREVTLDPGEVLEFTYEWNLLDDHARDLRRSFFRYIADPSCADRCLAYTEDFTLTCEVGIFAGKEKVEPPGATYALSYVTSHVNPSRCPPIDASSPRRIEPSAGDQSCLSDTLSI